MKKVTKLLFVRINIFILFLYKEPVATHIPVNMLWYSFLDHDYCSRFFCPFRRYFGWKVL